MKKDEHGELPYTSVFDCIGKTVDSEGISGLWAGFSSYAMRMAPCGIITLLS